MKFLGLMLLVICTLASAYDLDDFLRDNDKILKAQLQLLSKGDIGKVVRPIRLTDGSKILGQHKYLGTAVKSGQVSIYMFESESGSLEAYLWSEAGEFKLPHCENEIVGEGQYVLSGDVYTFTVLKPGFVVQTLCPELEWIE